MGGARDDLDEAGVAIEGEELFAELLEEELVDCAWLRSRDMAAGRG